MENNSFFFKRFFEVIFISFHNLLKIDLIVIGVGFKIDKKNKNQLIIISVLLVSFILLLPVIYNFRLIFGIGHYNINNNFNNDLVGGTGGLNVDFDLLITDDDRYTGTINFNTISSGSVDAIGIISITYNIYRNTQTIAYYTNSFDPPRIELRRVHNSLHCERENEIKCEGTATVRFLVGAVEQEEVINFELSIIIMLSSLEIEYSWDVMVVWLQVFDYVVIFCLILILIRNIRRIKFEKQYTEEMRKEDEEFWKKIEKEKTL
ncbi:MAG: hypothetical protein ACFE8E_07800 [Candidatus Hodarchaeota archaeon]